jgi:4-hydroxy-tetrahydrodipicolinate reductase
MGQRLVALASADPAFEVAAAVESSMHPRIGQDAGVVAGTGPIGVMLGHELPSGVDVVIDFSVPPAAEAVVEACSRRSIPVVVATTGLNDIQRQTIARAAERTAVLWSPSMSLAVNLAMRLVQSAGQSLRDHPTGVDVEIVERHHRFKEDAPSGTALKFGQLIAGTMGQTGSRHGREGRLGVRPPGEIGYHAVRAGDHPGEHTIIFGLLGESLEISVRATSRDSYAHGALLAARFLAGKPPGLYGMEHVL